MGKRPAVLMLETRGGGKRRLQKLPTFLTRGPFPGSCRNAMESAGGSMGSTTRCPGRRDGELVDARRGDDELVWVDRGRGEVLDAWRGRVERGLGQVGEGEQGGGCGGCGCDWLRAFFPRSFFFCIFCCRFVLVGPGIES
jgi:hypothetical protein